MSFQINDRLYWPEGKRKAFTLSYDDGIEQDRRLVRMMNERKVRGTFNLNSGLFGRKGRVAAGKKEVDHIKIPAEEIIRLYENHEVAGHGVNHESMYGMDTARCAEEILTCRKELEQITGRPLTGFAYAFGAVDENILNAVRLSGISYARTITSTYKFDIPLDFLQWNPTCHHDDERVMELADAFLSDDFYPCTVRQNCFMYGDIVMNLTRTITGITWRSCWIKWLSKMMYGMQRTDRSRVM